MQTRRDVFQAIADPTRRGIISLLARESLNLNAIAENFDMSRPAISQHIKILTECGLILIRKEGRERYCDVRVQQLDEVTDWIEEFRLAWAKNFNELDNLLDELKTKEKRRSAKTVNRKTAARKTAGRKNDSSRKK